MPRKSITAQNPTGQHPTGQNPAPAATAAATFAAIDGAAIKSALKTDQDLLKLLIRAMETGWTSSGEADAVRVLRSL